MKLFIIALAIAEKEPSTIDGIIGMILGAMVCIAVTLCSMLLCGMKIRTDPEKNGLKRH